MPLHAVPVLFVLSVAWRTSHAMPSTWRRTLLKIGYISDHRHGVCARGKCRGGSLGPWGTAFQPEPRLEKALASVVLKQSRISDIAKQHLHLFLSRDLLHFGQ